jgi:glycosyltransferase involved in cell wall biosynthesis
MMVTTEYPPMQGGVGKYSASLATSLRKCGLDVFVVCNEKGNGDFYGLSPFNSHNSEVLLNAVTKSKPDIVHVQYEPGLYGLVLDPINPTKINTNIDSFYARCKVPIITTFHSGYNFKQWINLAAATTSSKHKINRYTSYAVNLWKRVLNYRSSNRLNKEKSAMSAASIFFSQYLSNMICGDGNIGSSNNNNNIPNHNHYCQVIYHGAKPYSKIISRPSKRDARAMFSLPEGPRIALALGYKTATKGWDLFENMKIPDGWIIVANGSENHYSKENMILRFNKQEPRLVNLQMDFITDEDLSFLFYAADATILPYKVCSGSGVMFDGLAHGLPFVASDLGFFREFSSKGLGITVKREPAAFAHALKALDKNYEAYSERVCRFKGKLKWDVVAAQHASLYRLVTNADRGKPILPLLSAP